MTTARPQRHRSTIQFSFAYLAFSPVQPLLVSGRRSEFAKDVELLVSRHQLTVLARQQRRPLLGPADRACSRAHPTVPAPPRHELVVTPQTLLRWYDGLDAFRCGSEKHVAPGEHLFVAARANLQLAVAIYLRSPGEARSRPLSARGAACGGGRVVGVVDWGGWSCSRPSACR